MFPKNFRIFEWHKEVFLVIIIFLYNKQYSMVMELN